MGLLDDLNALKRIDRSDMVGRACALPATCLEGWEKGLAWKIPSMWSSSEQLLVLGMGGSAIGADLLQGFLRGELSRPVIVNRAYTLPKWVGRSTLVLACSYSGNTEETLSAAREAKKKGARLLAITSGGELSRWARRSRFPLLQIPSGWPPRSAVGYLTFSPLGLLVRLGWLKEKALPVRKACADTDRFIAGTLALSVKTQRNPAKRLALHLVGKIPILYGASDGWEGVTYRWRTQLEENAKTLAFHHLFPEATHNEISGWLHPKEMMRRLAAVFLLDPAIHPRTRRRMDFTAALIRRQGASALEVRGKGSSLMSRMLTLVSLGDFTSIYLALLYRIDPTPVDRVEALKKFMKR